MMYFTFYRAATLFLPLRGVFRYITMGPCIRLFLELTCVGLSTYDSMYYGSVSKSTMVQLASLYRKEAPENLEVRIIPIQQQQGGSDCGVFAAAVCVVLAQGGDPSMVRLRQNRMRMHLKGCFETGCITPFTASQRYTAPEQNQSRSISH